MEQSAPQPDLGPARSLSAPVHMTSDIVQDGDTPDAAAHNQSIDPDMLHYASNHQPFSADSAVEGGSSGSPRSTMVSPQSLPSPNSIDDDCDDDCDDDDDPAKEPSFDRHQTADNGCNAHQWPLPHMSSGPHSISMGLGLMQQKYELSTQQAAYVATKAPLPPTTIKPQLAASPIRATAASNRNLSKSAHTTSTGATFMGSIHSLQQTRKDTTPTNKLTIDTTNVAHSSPDRSFHSEECRRSGEMSEESIIFVHDDDDDKTQRTSNTRSCLEQRSLEDMDLGTEFTDSSHHRSLQFHQQQYSTRVSSLEDEMDARCAPDGQHANYGVAIGVEVGDGSEEHDPTGNDHSDRPCNEQHSKETIDGFRTSAHYANMEKDSQFPHTSGGIFVGAFSCVPHPNSEEAIRFKDVVKEPSFKTTQPDTEPKTTAIPTPEHNYPHDSDLKPPRSTRSSRSLLLANAPSSRTLHSTTSSGTTQSRRRHHLPDVDDEPPDSINIQTGTRADRCMPSSSECKAVATASVVDESNDQLKGVERRLRAEFQQEAVRISEEVCKSIFAEAAVGTVMDQGDEAIHVDQQCQDHNNSSKGDDDDDDLEQQSNTQPKHEGEVMTSQPSRKMSILMVCVCLFVVAVLVGGIVFFVFKNDDGDASADDSLENTTITSNRNNNSTQTVGGDLTNQGGSEMPSYVMRYMYGIIVKDALVQSIPPAAYVPDLISMMDTVAMRTMNETAPGPNHRALWSSDVDVKLPTIVESVTKVDCSEEMFVNATLRTDRCEEVVAAVEMMTTKNLAFINHYFAEVKQVLMEGQPQEILQSINPTTPVVMLGYIDKIVP